MLYVIVTGYRPIPKPRNRSKITSLKSDIIGDTHQIPADAVYQNPTTSRDQDLTSLDTQWEDMFMSVSYFIFIKKA